MDSAFLYCRKRKSGNFDLDDVDTAEISEKDRMLREKEAEVLYITGIVTDVLTTLEIMTVTSIGAHQCA